MEHLIKLISINCLSQFTVGDVLRVYDNNIRVIDDDILIEIIARREHIFFKKTFNAAIDICVCPPCESL